MKVCFYVGEGIVFQPLASAVKEVFPESMRLTGGSAEWRKQIAGADILLVHLAGNEPMGFVALGMGEALEKKVVMVVPAREFVPVEIASRAAIEHGWNIDFLRSELIKLANPVAGESHGAESAADKFHNLFGDLLKQHGYKHKGAVDVDGTVFTLHDQEMDLALVQEVARRARSLNLRVRLL